MWLATKHGFFSIVKKGPDEFHLRARVKGDLDNLAILAWDRAEIVLPDVQRWPRADYRFRIVADRATALNVIFALAEDIDYANFKSAIAATPDQREKLSAYHDIWGTMMALQK